MVTLSSEVGFSLVDMFLGDKFLLLLISTCGKLTPKTSLNVLAITRKSPDSSACIFDISGVLHKSSNWVAVLKICNVTFSSYVREVGRSSQKVTLDSTLLFLWGCRFALNYKGEMYIKMKGCCNLGSTEPPNRCASFAILSNTRRTISPKYMPPIIFSNPWTVEQFYSQPLFLESFASKMIKRKLQALLSTPSCLHHVFYQFF